VITDGRGALPTVWAHDSSGRNIAFQGGSMFEFMIRDVFLNTAVLYTILYLVAKHEADYSFARVAMVTAVTSLGAFLIQIFLFEMIGWFTIGLVFLLTAAMIMTFCWVRLWKTVIVVTLFCAFHFGIEISVDDIQEHFFPDDSEDVDSAQTSAIDMAEIEASWEAAKKTLVLSGTISAGNGDFTAMVNGEVVDVNDTVSVRVKKKTYQWRVHSISKHDIKYERLGIQPK
jgi:hypothetical protein